MSDSKRAIDRLSEKVALSGGSVWIPPHMRVVKGKTQRVKGYFRTMKRGQRTTVTDMRKDSHGNNYEVKTEYGPEITAGSIKSMKAPNGVEIERGTAYQSEANGKVYTGRFAGYTNGDGLPIFKDVSVYDPETKERSEVNERAFPGAAIKDIETLQSAHDKIYKPEKDRRAAIKADLAEKTKAMEKARKPIDPKGDLLAQFKAGRYSWNTKGQDDFGREAFSLMSLKELKEARAFRKDEMDSGVRHLAGATDLKFIDAEIAKRPKPAPKKTRELFSIGDKIDFGDGASWKMGDRVKIEAVKEQYAPGEQKVFFDGKEIGKVVSDGKGYSKVVTADGAELPIASRYERHGSRQNDRIKEAVQRFHKRDFKRDDFTLEEVATKDLKPGDWVGGMGEQPFRFDNESNGTLNGFLADGSPYGLGAQKTAQRFTPKKKAAKKNGLDRRYFNSKGQDDFGREFYSVAKEAELKDLLKDAEQGKGPSAATDAKFIKAELKKRADNPALRTFLEDRQHFNSKKRDDFGREFYSTLTVAQLTELLSLAKIRMARRDTPSLSAATDIKSLESALAAKKKTALSAVDALRAKVGLPSEAGNVSLSAAEADAFDAIDALEDQIVALGRVYVPPHTRVNPKTRKTENVDGYWRKGRGKSAIKTDVGNARDRNRKGRTQKVKSVSHDSGGPLAYGPGTGKKTSKKIEVPHVDVENPHERYERARGKKGAPDLSPLPPSRAEKIADKLDGPNGPADVARRQRKSEEKRRDYVHKVHSRDTPPADLEEGALARWEATKARQMKERREAGNRSAPAAEKWYADYLKRKEADNKAALSSPEAAKQHFKKVAAGEQPIPDGVPGAGTKADPLRLEAPESALEALSKGFYVELNQPSSVSTFLDELRERVNEAKTAGKEPPNIDLCKVTVPGTNLFCSESKGVERAKMPQLSGIPTAGTKADKLPKDKKGGVNLGDAFREHLAEKGFAITDRTVPAQNLRATQNELNGAKVAGITGALEAGKIKNARLFVSKDDYIVDGHHRWAANVAADSRDNALGDQDMEVAQIDMPILELLVEANAFAADWGIPQAGVFEPNKPKGADSKAPKAPSAVDRLSEKVDKAAPGKPKAAGKADAPEADAPSLGSKQGGDAPGTTRRPPGSVSGATDDEVPYVTPLSAEPLTDEQYQAEADRVEKIMDRYTEIMNDFDPYKGESGQMPAPERMAKAEAMAAAGEPVPTDARFMADHKTGAWVPERAALHKEIISTFLQRANDVPKENKAAFTGGLGGSGKGSALEAGVAGKLDLPFDPEEYFTVDPDAIKEYLAELGVIPTTPGLAPMEASALVHEESSYLAKEIAAKLQAQGTNMIWDITMASEGSVDKRIKALESNGYTDIKSIFVDVTIEQSVKQALGRHRRGLEAHRKQALAGDVTDKKQHGGRFVPPKLIQSHTASGPDRNSANREHFEALKERFADWAVVDNTGLFDEDGNFIKGAESKITETGGRGSAGSKADPSAPANRPKPDEDKIAASAALAGMTPAMLRLVNKAEYVRSNAAGGR